MNITIPQSLFDISACIIVVTVMISLFMTVEKEGFKGFYMFVLVFALRIIVSVSILHVFHLLFG